MTQYYQALGIGYSNILTNTAAVQNLRDTLDLNSLDGTWSVPSQFVRQEVVDFLSGLNIQVHQVLGFRIVGDEVPPHTDDPGPGDWARLLWCDGSEFDMLWHQLRPGEQAVELIRPRDGATHYMAPVERVTEVHRQRLSTVNPAIVRIGNLHSGINHSVNPAYLWQIWPQRDGQNMTFDQLKSAFSGYLLG